MKSNFNFAAPSLADLSPGEEGVVDAIDISDPVGRRLMALGLRPNTHVRVLRRAPLGDPSVYELRSFQLCLRRSEARRVRLRQDEPQA